MKKFACISVLLSTLAFGASSSEQDGISIVVGSTRASGQIVGPVISAVLDTKNSNTTHLKSFSGKAITVDIHPTVIKAPHLKVDALTYKFSPLKNVYVERFFTFGENGPFDNCTAKLLENLVKYMSPGASLEIEWDPCTTLCGTPILSEVSTYTIPYIKTNPFHAFFDMNIALNAFWAVIHGNKREISNLPDCVRIPSEAMIPSILNLMIHFIIEGNLNLEKMQKRLFLEIQILKYLLQNPDKVLLCKSGPISDFGVFEAEERLYLQASTPATCIAKGRTYDGSSFLQFSSLNYFISNLAVTNQWPYVKEYLATIGFPDATLERKTSPHNGRKNVWIITGLKS